MRLVNLVNQFRSDNKGLVQPLRMYFIDEKKILSQELTSFLTEDQYKDEVFYVDFLADIHSKIQSKMN